MPSADVRKRGHRAPWIFLSKIQTLNTPQGRKEAPLASNKAGTLKGDYRTLWSWLECVVKRYPHLPPTPVAMLVEIGMTGRNPAYTEILDQLLESDPAEYKAVIRANPWLTHGWVPLEVQMDALKTVMPYLMPRLESMASTGEEEEDDSSDFGGDFWAKVNADSIMRGGVERILAELPPLRDKIPGQ
jgi:hypothetical protein